MKKIYFKKILITSIASLFLIQALYISAFEPIYLSAAEDYDDVIVSLTVESGIALSEEDDVTMAPTMGVTSNSSIGSVTWNVKTNNYSGYHLAIKADSSPALVGDNTYSFADYSESTPGTPEVWAVDSGEYQFGYSAYGDNVSDATWGTGTSCGTASTISTNNLNYLGFKTSNNTIANSTGVTSTSGTDTNICFAAEQNGVYAPSGTYTANIYATATTN